MQVLMQAAEGMSVTFHRAFDMCADPFGALDDIIGLGCDRILTSGQKNTAAEGKELLAELVRRADGRLIIMPGSGVNAGNVRELAEVTGAVEFHLSGRAKVDSGMRWRNPEVSMGGTVRIDEYQRDLTDPELVAAAVAALEN